MDKEYKRIIICNKLQNINKYKDKIKKLQYQINNLNDEYKEYIYHHNMIKKSWRKRSIYDEYNDNYFTLYKIYLSQKFCERCNKEFNSNIKNDVKCLDHNHENGRIRGIICFRCNTFLK